MNYIFHEFFKSQIIKVIFLISHKYDFHNIQTPSQITHSARSHANINEMFANYFLKTLAKYFFFLKFTCSRGLQTSICEVVQW